MNALRWLDLALGWLLVAIGVLISVLLAHKHCWVLAMLVLATALGTRRAFALYMPSENTQTLFRNRNGYVTRVVTAGSTVLYSPVAEKPSETIEMGFRSTDLRLRDVRTLDDVPCDLRVKVYFSLDLGLVPRDTLHHIVGIPDKGWQELVLTICTGEIISYWGCQGSDRVLQNRNRDAVCNELSLRVGTELRALGVVVRRRHGVSIQEIQPSRGILSALVEKEAMQYKGQSVAHLLRELRDQLGYGATEAVQAALAHAILANGRSPSALSIGDWEQLRAANIVDQETDGAWNEDSAMLRRYLDAEQEGRKGQKGSLRQARLTPLGDRTAA